MNRSRILGAGALMALLLWSAGAVMAAENAWSVEYFNSRKSEWDQLLGASMRLEGRVSLVGGGQLRLAKCEVVCRAADSVLRPIQGKKSVEIVGRLKKENGKYSLEIDRVQAVPTDLEQYESRAAKLKNPKAPDWYELGDWAAERGRFYEDGKLLEKAQSSYNHAINAELRAMDADNAEGRFQLAGKISQYMLPDARRMELMHEGDRILWAAAIKTKPIDKAALTKLAARIAEDLPGSTKPLASIPKDLKSRYEQEPLAVYRDSADDVRQQLHRIFYTTVLLKAILEDAEKDGRNGDQIALALEQQVPEAKPMADYYRNLKLNYRMERATTATRPEIEQLAADLRATQQLEPARVVLTKWLQVQEPRLRRDGPLGLLQLAEDYLSLLQDERKAVTILAEANKIDPAFSDVSDKLKSLGYSQVGGSWIKAGQQATNPAVPMDPAMTGNVAVGMNATEARNIMRGPPESLSRILTRKGVEEIWSYGPAGTSRIIIRLERASLSPEMRVVEVRNGL